MDYTEDKEYQYTRVDGSIYTLEDPFPDITETYWGNTDLAWNPEDKISWDELAPSLQELILAKLKTEEANIEIDSLSDEIKNELAKIATLESSLFIETTERQESDKALDDKITQIINFESRLDHVENEIENIYENLAEIREEINDILEEIAKIKERLDDLEDRMDEAEDQIRKLWQEIWYIWGSTNTTFTASTAPTGTAEYLRYKQEKWTIPKIWFDLWFLWGRSTTYNVYRQTPLQETEYEADYTLHKKEKWNIPHIWDEIWWAWGGSYTPAGTKEEDNEALFNKYRNHSPSWDIPHIWFDFWFLWSRDTTRNVYTTTPNQETEYEADYVSHKQEKFNIPHIWDEIYWLWGGVNTPPGDYESNNWNSFILYSRRGMANSRGKDTWNIPHIWFDLWFLWARSVPTEVYVGSDPTASVINHRIKEHDYLSHRLEKWNIPHIWDELWYLWGGELEPSNDNEENNESSFVKYRWRYRDGATGHQYQWNIPHIWYDVWYLWTRTYYADPSAHENDLETEYVSFKFHHGDTTNPNAWNIPHIWDEIWWVWSDEPEDPTTDIEKETLFEEWRNHINPATDKYLTIPNIWKDIWFIWGDGTEEDYVEHRQQKWNIPHIWYDIWYVWSRAYYADPSAHEEDLEDDYVLHKFHNEDTTSPNAWNIPHIWDEIWWAWGGRYNASNANETSNETLFLKYRNHKYNGTDVPWDIPHIWFDIWFLWSRDTTYKTYLDTPNAEDSYEAEYRLHKLQIYNIPHIWDEIWWIWGGHNAATNANEAANKAEFDYYRNHSPSWDIPHIWYDFWFLWSRTPYESNNIYAKDSSQEHAYELDYTNHKKAKWNIPHIWDEIWWIWSEDPNVPQTDEAKETAFKLYRDKTNAATSKYLTIPNIWKDIWFIWGDGTEANYVTNRQQKWNIPHIWYDVWFIWSRTEYAFGANPTNNETDYLNHRVNYWNIPHIWDEIWDVWGIDTPDNPTIAQEIANMTALAAAKQKYKPIPDLWKAIWYTWSGSWNEDTAKAAFDSNTSNDKTFTWDIPHIWNEIAYIWGVANNTSFNDLSAFRANHTSKNIPKIWEELSYIWGETDADLSYGLGFFRVNYSNKNIPSIWQAIYNTWTKDGSDLTYQTYAALSNKKNIPYIWDAIDNIWGDSTYMQNYNDYNIKAIWEELDNLSDTYLEKAVYEQDQKDLWGSYYNNRNDRTKNIEKLWDAIDDLNTDIDNIWGNSTTKSNHDTKNITKAWEAIDECKEKIEEVKADVELLKKTAVGISAILTYQWNENIVNGGASNLPHSFAMHMSSTFTVSSKFKNVLLFDLVYKFNYGISRPVRPVQPTDNPQINHQLYIPLAIPCNVNNDLGVYSYAFGYDRTIAFQDPDTKIFIYYPMNIQRSGDIYSSSSSSFTLSHALVRDNNGAGNQYPDQPIMFPMVHDLPAAGDFEITVSGLEVTLDAEITGSLVDEFVNDPGEFIKAHLANKNQRAFSTQADANYLAEYMWSQMIYN